MLKVAINTSIGCFKLSEKGALRCYELGMKEIATSVEESYPGITITIAPDKEQAWLKRYHTKELAKDLKYWRKYLLGESNDYYTPFTPDEKHVLDLYVSSDLRAHPILIQVLEEMQDAYEEGREFKIVEIPDIEYTIEASEEGYESIHEKHRIWS